MAKVKEPLKAGIFRQFTPSKSEDMGGTDRGPHNKSHGSVRNRQHYANLSEADINYVVQRVLAAVNSGETDASKITKQVVMEQTEPEDVIEIGGR